MLPVSCSLLAAFYTICARNQAELSPFQPPSLEISVLLVRLLEVLSYSTQHTLMRNEQNVLGAIVLKMIKPFNNPLRKGCQRFASRYLDSLALPPLIKKSGELRFYFSGGQAAKLAGMTFIKIRQRLLEWQLELIRYNLSRFPRPS